MYFLYVDESGDTGIPGSSDHFILSGVVFHELVWHKILSSIIQFRQGLKQKYGLKLREEIHAAHFIHRPGDLSRIKKSLRLQLLRDVIDFEAGLTDINIINVVVDKSNKPSDYRVFEYAWTTLIQRFHNTISYKNFPGPQNPQDYGLMIVDQTDVKKLRGLLRQMRRYNPVPNMRGTGYQNILLDTIVEDPVHRDSLHSYFIQIADVSAYFLKQKLSPSKYIKSKGAKNYFNRLDPVLCKVASRVDPQGVVFL